VRLYALACSSTCVAACRATIWPIASWYRRADAWEACVRIVWWTSATVRSRRLVLGSADSAPRNPLRRLRK